MQNLQKQIKDTSNINVLIIQIDIKHLKEIQLR
jgi:short-subunit dehydrogenase